MTDRKICLIDGCGKPAKGRGWCAAHWWRWRNHGDPLKLAPEPIKPTVCSVEGCRNPPNGKKGFCNTHYLRQYRYGDVHHTERAGNGVPFEWLLAHMAHEGEGCLTWPFAIGTDGRGMLGDEWLGTPQAHRCMCMLVNGMPPSDIHEAAHSCGKGHEGCVHPKHLRWATPLENAADKILHGTSGNGTKAQAAFRLKAANNGGGKWG